MAIDLTRTELTRRRDDLAAKLSAVEADIESVKAEMAVRLKGGHSDAQRLRAEIGQIDAEISRRETRDAIVPSISDHALLRYIERVHGIDVDAMKAALLTETVVLAIKTGATAIKTSEGTFVIKGSTVVTFKGADMDARRRVPRNRPDADEAWSDADEERQ